MNKFIKILGVTTLAVAMVAGSHAHAMIDFSFVAAPGSSLTSENWQSDRTVSVASNFTMIAIQPGNPNQYNASVVQQVTDPWAYGPWELESYFGGLQDLHFVTNAGGASTDLFSVSAGRATFNDGTYAAVQTYTGETFGTLTIAAPEPSTWGMLGLGVATLAFARRRSRRPAISIV
ncbi:putative secreted protein with PEP-CTERM sorting signal [Roseiarcus fermentans]|uniref:Putative secreted protein with PEP-CTERM sorting signal n=2 Tax=Roseiarcus fermentans TaxID=1473586 RepID=A0A366EX67_9HYPH|nr:putative secreted protein with PEP-CTERM sorting signal [Roseiarcus fermentans]